MKLHVGVMTEVKTIDLMLPSKCCPNTTVPVRRYVFIDESRPPQNGSLYFSSKASNPNVVSYKALSYAHGTRFKYNVKRVGLIGSSGRIGQAAQAVGSYLLPGDISPLRSPVRSAAWAAITPGMPGLRGVRPGKKNRTARCPEGYQFGGRFTDNQFSTCGQKLFDLPGPLGMAISAIARALRAGERALQAAAVEGTPLGAGDYGDSGIEARRPQIPRVAEANTKAMLAQIERLTRDMGAPNVSAARMVRRDGFVLEPVVSPKILRAIPDNRDMEGATYLLRVNDLPSLGQDELGLLSNTGVTNVTWVLPGGSTLQLEKVRPLTIGERRKLGRTVNAAASIDNSRNPAARLQKVAEETGDGIKYSENFVGVQRPHELVRDKKGKETEKWVLELLQNKLSTDSTSSRESSSLAAIGDKIMSLSEALDHIAAGGSLSRISPNILQQALANANLFKRRNLGSGIESFDGPNNRSYIMRQSRLDFSRLDDAFASDFQQHLGLESPDVYQVSFGKRSRYLVDSTRNVYPGFDKNRDVSLSEVDPRKMAALVVSDFVNGTNSRNPGSIDIFKRENGADIAVSDFSSELTELAKISITERQKQAIEAMDSLTEDGVYGQYFKELKAAQRRLFIQEIRKLLARAREFNFVNYKDRLTRDGVLTDVEKTHLGIIETITEQRLNVLERQQDILMAVLGGNK
jgi:hypothetical protein